MFYACSIFLNLIIKMSIINEQTKTKLYFLGTNKLF